MSWHLYARPERVTRFASDLGRYSPLGSRGCERSGGLGSLKHTGVPFAAGPKDDAQPRLRRCKARAKRLRCGAQRRCKARQSQAPARGRGAPPERAARLGGRTRARVGLRCGVGRVVGGVGLRCPPVWRPCAWEKTTFVGVCKHLGRCGKKTSIPKEPTGVPKV